MNIRIFVFQPDDKGSSARTMNELEFAFRDFLPDEESVLHFKSVIDAVPQISKAFQDSHCVFFFTDPSIYAETKKKLAKSFALEMTLNENLQSMAFETLNKIISAATAEEYAHCVVPKNSHIFNTPDGLYSGFAVSSGNQTIVYLPLIEGRTQKLLASQVMPFLSSSYGIELNADCFKETNCNRLVTSLEGNDKTLCIATTNTSSYFRNYISGKELLTERVKESGRTEKRGSMQPKDYIINLSIMAREFMETSYGIAMSNAYFSGNDDKSEKVVYLAVTDEKKTSLREVHSLSGESIDDFLSRACGDFCVFISDVLDTDNAVGHILEVTNNTSIKKYKTAIAITSALIAAVLAACVVLFTSNSYSIKTWFVNMKNRVFPGQAPVETTLYFNEYDYDIPGNYSETPENNVLPDDEVVASDEETLTVSEGNIVG